jgi:hypothetical protein
MADDTKSWIKERNANVRAKRLASASPSRRVGVSGLKDSAAVKAAAGSVAETAGNIVGLARGGARLAQGAAGAMKLTENMLDPVYGLLHGGQPAWLPLEKAADNAVRQGWSEVRHPIRTIKEGASRANAALNPFATPVAPTTTGEIRRRFDIGKNQGEVLFDIGSAALAPEAMAGPALSAEEQVAKYMAQGMDARVVQTLAEPYNGMGYHYIPKRGVFGVKLPKIISDSPFNLLKPSGISRGEMHKLHYEVDPKFHGARLADHAGQHWSGKRLGLKKNHPVVQVVRGAPTALKRTVSGAGGGVVGAVGAKPRNDR